jgi:hypothetical protein
VSDERSQMGHQVAWIIVEPGWRVLDSKGEEVGRIDSVVGDKEADIFNGLAVSAGGLSRARHVPAEHVRTIEEGWVGLDLTVDELRDLPAFEQTPSVRILPE